MLLSSSNACISDAKTREELSWIIDQGFYAQPVTTKIKPLFGFIPKSKGKHAVEVLKRIDALFLVKVKNDFRIRLGPETMTASDQLLAQGRVIVNLTVENQPKGFILIGEGLSAVR